MCWKRPAILHVHCRLRNEPISLHEVLVAAVSRSLAFATRLAFEDSSYRESGHVLVSGIGVVLVC